jgi:hypothetical protein
MDDRSRRQVFLLVALLVVLAAVVWWNLGVSSGPVPGRRAPARAAGRAAPDAPPIEAVRLDALNAPRPTPAARGRDPFRFRAAPPPPPEPPPSRGDGSSAETESGGEPVALGPPPIPLRFIGVMRLPADGRLIAVLSDGNGVYRGSEGDIIEGRYRIVRLRPEAVELAYVDGRGQQVLRLSGS